MALHWARRTRLPPARTFAAAAAASPAEYCAAQVRRFDFENYLCVLLLPPSLRRSAFALRAFNIELAQVRDNVSDLNTGRMRLQFWQDSIDAMTGARPGPLPRTPVASELARAVTAAGLGSEPLKALIAARAARIAEKPFDSTTELERYGEATTAGLLRLQLQLGGLQDEVGLQEAARQLGAASAVGGQLRAVAILASRRGKVVLPLDVVAAHGVVEEDVLRGRCSPELRGVARQLAGRCRELLTECAAAVVQAGGGRHAVEHFLPAVPLRDYLRRLEAADFDPLAPATHVSPGTLPLTLWWARLRRRLV